MKKLFSILLVAVLILTLLAGCSSNDADVSSQEAQSSKELSDSEPVTLKVAYFEGGFGADWFEWLKAEYESLHENVTIELEGDANLNDTIVPKIEGGTETPDVFFVNGIKWKQWGTQGLVLEISDLYDMEVYGTESTLNEIINDAAKEYFYFDPVGAGVKKYAVPWSAGPFGVVYNKIMFDEHGWTYPNTYDEFLNLCELIKAEGIAPLTYPGIYKNYVSPFYRGWQIQSLGVDKWKEYKNPTSDEIYIDEALLKPWEKWEELNKKGYLLEGTPALNHTSAQIEFINEKAAMILNGYWLENEMADAWPDEYEIVMAPTPADGILNKNTMLTLIPDSGQIYGKTKHPEIAKDFLLFTLSPEATQKFAEMSGGLRPLNYDLSDAEVTDFIKSCLNTLSDNSIYSFTDKGGSELMYIDKNYDEMGEIESGNMTAEQAYKIMKNNAKKNYEDKKDELGLD